jgi:hypothetical protein
VSVVLHNLVLTAQDNPQAAHFVLKGLLKGIKAIVVGIGSIIAAIACAVIAAMKGRNPLGWGIAGFFCSILTLIIVIVIPSKK